MSPRIKPMRNLPFFKLNFWIISLIAAQFAAIIFLCLFIPSLINLAAALLLVWLLSAISSVILFARKGCPEIKLVWMVFIAALPVAGALVYLIASLPRKPYGVLTVTDGAKNGLSSAAGELCGTCAAGYANATYFPTGSEFWNAAQVSIKNAKKSVYIEFFIISAGHLMNTIMQSLEQAKKNGAEIKIIFDGVGSAFRLSKRDVKRLKSLGEVKTFHRLTPLPHSKINVRDHRKIIVVDGKTAFTGGVNLADEYVNLTSPHGFWKDTGVALHGSAAKIFEGMFLSVWNGSHEMSAPKIAPEETPCLPYYDSPCAKAFCEDLLVNAIHSAQTRVCVLTPYFCVSEKTAAALTFAARRGVDVSVIIPHVPDKKYAFAVSRAFAASLAPSGVKFYEYSPGFMHAKCVICDGNAFMGSYNFDFRSFHFNYECGVMLSGTVCDEILNDFNQCLALSAQITPTKRKGVLGFLLRFFAPLI